ncbi:helix-turn-helix domain-containing protein [Palleniella muris]|uniref:helix-turn-helix domain-containing protein n=1 Tax=Palleniella muris TaxID=3038145 RepID=UPI001441CA5A|nr:helix-turn-helix domain-containing protein [Palleniella muris]
MKNPDRALALIGKEEKSPSGGIDPLRLDLMRAWCYNVKRDYLQVEACVRRGLANDSIRLVPERNIPYSRLLVEALVRTNRYEEAINQCDSVIGMARTTGNWNAEAQIFCDLASIYKQMSYNSMAERCFDKTISLMKDSKDVRDMAVLSTAYGDYISFFIDQGRIDDALSAGYKKEAVIGRMSMAPGPPPGYIDREYGYLFTKMAFLLHTAGRKRESERYHAKFLSTDFSKTIEGKNYAIPFLISSNRFREAKALNEECIAAFANDTVSYEYLQLLQHKADIERRLKDYQAASITMKRCYTLRDTIYARESASEAQKFAVQFQLKEKEFELKMANANATKRNIFLTGITIITVLLIVLLWIARRNLSISKEKNKALANKLDKYIAEHEEHRRAYGESVLDVGESTLEAQATEEASESLASNSASESITSGGEGFDYGKFMKMESLIVDKKLFLEPRFGRDELCRIANVSKNDISPMLRRYAGADNVTDYINRLKVEYSIKLMSEKPYLSIDAIAAESNFTSRSTFYRVFQKICGMSPAQYQKTKLE